MNVTPINAPSAPAPAGGYSQALLVEGVSELLVVSGQIPESRQGDVPRGFDEQADLVWSNLGAQLASAGMGMENLVKVSTYLSSRDYTVANREARERALGSHRPALTVITLESSTTVGCWRSTAWPPVDHSP